MNVALYSGTWRSCKTHTEFSLAALLTTQLPVPAHPHISICAALLFNLPLISCTLNTHDYMLCRHFANVKIRCKHYCYVHWNVSPKKYPKDVPNYNISAGFMQTFLKIKSPSPVWYNGCDHLWLSIPICPLVWYSTSVWKWSNDLTRLSVSYYRKSFPSQHATLAAFAAVYISVSNPLDTWHSWHNRHVTACQVIPLSFPLWSIS